MMNKILIVEDEFIVANDLRLTLQQAGYKVIGVAASHEEAVEKINKESPDLVLLDIQLQGKLTGIHLARKLKTDNVAFVYLSAYSSQKVLEEAKTTEPYGFLVKPFRENDLLATLEIALYRHRHSLESSARREDSLRKQLVALAGGDADATRLLLHLGRFMQSHVPFDLLSIHTRPGDASSIIGYLRIGYDEYQLIGEKELITISGVTKAALAELLPGNNEYITPAIFGDSQVDMKGNAKNLQQFFAKTFNLFSFVVYPVKLNSDTTFTYSFYSRQQNGYSPQHVNVLCKLMSPMAAIAEKIAGSMSIRESGASQPVPHDKHKHGEEVNPFFDSIIGNHHLLLTALDLVTQVAPYNTSVLILGESGTGKEKIAESIHALSPRKDGPFVKVNCAAIPITLIESELFGHEKGSFTGAMEKRKGKFELAHGGTIFLDEIGDLPLEVQVKLLRVLQEKEIQPVGGNLPQKINVRIVTATNRNLEKEVAAGNFRLDLYYRLNVFPVSLPALRDRKSDIDALSTFFGQKFATEFNKQFYGIAASMQDEMYAYSWPGNIRELENVIEQAVILSDGLSPLQLKRSLISSAAFAGKNDIKNLDDVKRVQQDTERDYIISVLKKTRGRIRGLTGAAELLNIKPTTLESKIDKLNIKREEFRN
jgi:DNA-binding NtrC family response regulator